MSERYVEHQFDSEGYPVYPSEETKFRQMNRIVGINRWKTILLVEAETSRDIRPPLYELPADIIMRRRKPAIVAFGHYTLEEMEENVKKYPIYPASGVIVPRLVRWTDEMLGYKHTYVILDSHGIPANAFDDVKEAEKKRAEEEYNMPIFFDD